MGTKQPVVTGPELVRALERAGFAKVRQVGSHVTLEKGRLHATVPVHGSREVPKGTVAAILRSAEMTVDDLRRLL
jgi:predicted RNA binding protein YcfA (HicA-like mRNA interferase family)